MPPRVAPSKHVKQRKPSISSEAPILRLPTDLTSSLMRLVLDYPKGLGKSERRQILALIMVCQAWRAVAYSTPDLWRKLDVDIEGPYGPFLKKVTAWFDRAGHKVAFHLTMRCISPRQNVKAEDIVSLVNQYHFEYLHLSRTTTKLFLDRDPAASPISA